LKVNEIYPALNGEGIHVGVPTTIVRTQGCNLGCVYCDTEYAQDPAGGSEMSVSEMLETSDLRDHYRSWALITGGEPLLQPDLEDLVVALRKRGLMVEVETNGSILAPNWWELVDCWSVDIKCPSSGMEGWSEKAWLGVRSQDQLKFVVANENDLAYVSYFTRKLVSPSLVVSPAYPWTQPWLEQCADFCLRHCVRLSLQQHKIIYGERRRT